MIIITIPGASRGQVDELLKSIDAVGRCNIYTDENQRTIITVARPFSGDHLLALEAFPWVEKVMATESPYQLVARQILQPTSVIQVGDVSVGGQSFTVIAGPCAIESEKQLRETALHVKKAGATILRGGAYKPRTSPYAFQGMEREGLSILQAVGQELNMPVVSEILDPRHVEEMSSYVDLIQIGARNMSNTPLLKEVGRQSKPVLLKRNPMATYDEWLQAAEYVASEGNTRIILCERGIRTFETYTRNTLDLAAVPAVKHLSHLPIMVDPSHGTGRWRLVAPMALAAAAAGADGILVEVHPQPELALSDGRQSLQPERFAQLMKDLKTILPAFERSLGQEEEGV